ncbi:MAG: isochorismatase family protein [Phycisphaerales bacterium]|nr:isochorismatase family protein [Phycisphaerales bacterium]
MTETNNLTPDWRIAPATAQVVIIDVQERLAPHIHEIDRVIDRVRRLAAIAHALKLPVTITEQYVAGLGPTIGPVRDAYAGAPRFEKMTFSAWDDPVTRDAIIDNRRPHALIAGIEAHVCVQQTATDMRAEGLKPVILADAVGSRRPADAETALARMRGRGIDIATLEAVAFEMLRRAEGDAFRAVLSAVK